MINNNVNGFFFITIAEIRVITIESMNTQTVIILVLCFIDLNWDLGPLRKQDLNW